MYCYTARQYKIGAISGHATPALLMKYWGGYSPLSPPGSYAYVIMQVCKSAYKWVGYWLATVKKRLQTSAIFKAADT